MFVCLYVCTSLSGTGSLCVFWASQLPGSVCTFFLVSSPHCVQSCRLVCVSVSLFSWVACIYKHVLSVLSPVLSTFCPASALGSYLTCMYYNTIMYYLIILSSPPGRISSPPGRISSPPGRTVGRVVFRPMLQEPCWLQLRLGIN